MFRPQRATWVVTAASTQFAGVYYSDQATAQFTVAIDASRVTWTPTDFYGTVGHQVQATVSSGKVTVMVPTGGVWGWYDLHVDAYSGATEVLATQTAYGVIGRPASTVLDSPFSYSTHISKPSPEDPPSVSSFLCVAGGYRWGLIRSG